MYYPLRKHFLKTDKDRSGSLNVKEMKKFLSLDDMNDVRLAQLLSCFPPVFGGVCMPLCASRRLAG